MSKAPRASTALSAATGPLTHWFTWRHVRCKVVETPNSFAGHTHLELNAIAARDVPLPITRTGYKSHFIDPQALAEAGGPVALFTVWLEETARSKAYQDAEFRWRQGELFPETKAGPRRPAR